MSLKNIKYDLIEDIRRDKYYDEIELIRLISDSSISYKNKISNIKKIIKEITLNDAMISSIEEILHINDDTKED